MIIDSRDVVFFKNVFPYKHENKASEKTHEIMFSDEGSSKPIVNVKVEPRSSKGSRLSNSFGPDFITYALESEPQIFKETISTLEAQI